MSSPVRASRYPPAVVSMASAPSTLRIRPTQICTCFADDAGGSSPHMASESWSGLTTSPRRTASAPSARRSRGLSRAVPVDHDRPEQVHSHCPALSDGIGESSTTWIPDGYREATEVDTAVADGGAVSGSAARNTWESTMTTTTSIQTSKPATATGPATRGRRLRIVAAVAALGFGLLVGCGEAVNGTGPEIGAVTPGRSPVLGRRGRATRRAPSPGARFRPTRQSDGRPASGQGRIPSPPTRPSGGPRSCGPSCER